MTGDGAPSQRLGLFSCMMFLTLLTLGLVIASLPELVDARFGVRGGGALFIAIEMVAAMVAALLGGTLADRSGRRRPWIVLGYGLSALCFWFLIVAPTFPLLLVARAIQGGSAALAWSLVLTVAADGAPPERRGRAMGVMGATIILGVAVGIPLGGVVASTAGTLAPLWMGTVVLAALCGVAMVLPEHPIASRPATIADTIASIRGAPHLRVPYAFSFADRFSAGYFIVSFPLFVSQAFDMGPAQRGGLIALFFIPFALLQVPFSWRGDRKRRVPALVGGAIGYGLCLGSLGAAALVPWGLPLLWLLLIGAGASAAMMFPASLTLTTELAPEGGRATAIGGFNAAGSAGFAIGPLLAALALTFMGPGPSFVFVGVVMLTVVAVSWPALRTFGKT